MHVPLPLAADSDDAAVASFHQIGLSVSKGFDWQGLDDATKSGLARAIKTGEQIVDRKWEAAGETTNGWKYTFAGGRASIRDFVRLSPTTNPPRKSPIRFSIRTPGSMIRGNH